MKYFETRTIRIQQLERRNNDLENKMLALLEKAFGKVLDAQKEDG